MMVFSMVSASRLRCAGFRLELRDDVFAGLALHELERDRAARLQVRCQRTGWRP